MGGTAVLEAPRTIEELRSRTAELADDVDEQLDLAELAFSTGDGSGEFETRRDQRDAFSSQLRAGIRSLAASPVWRSHDLTTELLLLNESLRDEQAADEDATDPEWRVREVLQRMAIVLEAMGRQARYTDLDDPALAAHYIATALQDIEVSDVAALLGTTTRMVASYRSGEIKTVRKNKARITWLAHLVDELRGSVTPRGAVLWFDAHFPQLNGSTPRELLEEDPQRHGPRLLALARGGRGQLDQGGAQYGALDESA